MGNPTGAGAQSTGFVYGAGIRSNAGGAGGCCHRRPQVNARWSGGCARCAGHASDCDSCVVRGCESRKPSIATGNPAVSASGSRARARGRFRAGISACTSGCIGSCSSASVDVRTKASIHGCVYSGIGDGSAIAGDSAGSATRRASSAATRGSLKPTRASGASCVSASTRGSGSTCAGATAARGNCASYVRSHRFTGIG